MAAEEAGYTQEQIVKLVWGTAYRLFRERKISELRDFLKNFNCSELRFIYESMNFIGSYVNSKEEFIKRLIFELRTAELKELCHIDEGGSDDQIQQG